MCPIESVVSAHLERCPAAAGGVGAGCFVALAHAPELMGGVNFAGGVVLIADDEVGFGGVAGHGDGIAFGRVGGRFSFDVVGYDGALVAEVDASANLVGAVGEGGVGREVGEQEGIAGLHGDGDWFD